ncbi:MAG: cytidine deaminase [Carnobacterium sp.]|uniref:cytidine deaminase n=1 Tax=Carnobacterium sp. TaxID=48221 RepID=UPI003C775260
MENNEKITLQLVKEATEMLNNAYVPYSKFPVGASLVTDDGTIYSGCNIENASYGLSNCAERTTIFKAVSEGKKSFKKLVITGKTAGPISPCGACRQVMVEFCEPDMPVLLTNINGDKYETTVKELLPGAFQSEDMV